MTERVWTEDQFEQMSWHDNHVHGLRIVENEDGSGELILDIDHIVEWIEGSDNAFRFRILPATLTFHRVMFLSVSLDYATPTAGFTPFSISGIERRLETRERYVAQLWRIPINWPDGELTFEAHGFTQRSRGEPVLYSGQCLTPDLRGGA
jgi:hypothetical protein